MELICYLTNNNGNKYAQFNAMISIRGDFMLSCLEDLLNYNSDPECDALSEIDIPDDGNFHKYWIEVELTEFGTGVGLDSYIGYDILGYKKLT